MPKLKFFVVRPIHNRSNYVVHVYIKPACQEAAEAIGQDAEVIPAGVEASAAPITEDIFRHLEKDGYVVAYLGSPARLDGPGNKWFWNPNVMLEAGYRMGLGRPILFVRDAKRADDEPLLPFDLANHWVVELPTEEQERNDVDQIQKVVTRMRDLVLAGIGTPPEPSKGIYPAPAITFLFDPQGGKVKSASDDAAEFFGFPPGEELVSKSVEQVVEMINSRILPQQRDAFSREQSQLIGEVFMGRKPFASVCLVFGKEFIAQDSAISNAYLPIVARFERQACGSSTLDVIYLDVTETAKLGQDGVVRCQLGVKKKQ